MFKNTDLTKTDLYAILVGIFCAGLIISNIIATKTFEFFWITLPCGVIIFPLIYIVNDVLAECYGFKKARRAILLGFFMNLVAVICYNITMILPAPSYFVGDEAFQVVLGSTLRLLIASFAAYLIGSLINAKLMVYLKEKYENKLFFRCISSTFAGEGMDALIFITIGFLGTMPVITLFTMIVAQALFKTAYEIVIYPLTRRVIKDVKALEDY
ncbi:queuosine precursor transporter [uncultured Methanobrevibacter sp.]|uniref:queuosine precursor transporter n=1 Tax=uncultured Methanobrevibacter sp. TaxID=253161 RepID=UPI00260E792A|nr:queuosine precursor transporter [uncultured Methanobrevibacter sp.]